MQVPSVGDAGLDVDAGIGVDAGPPRCGSEVPPDAGVALTSSGAVLGATQGAVMRWLGIPFAAPPTGALRWKPPEPMPCWSGLRVATAFGPACAQRIADGGVVGSEDCLTLNVFAPIGARQRPVLVWIHGGGNVQGSAEDPLYDAQELAARQQSVVVTIQYRLGALGFFTHAALNAESDAGISGNYGIADQQAALRWVRENVAGFGGDPLKVLLFGESAGGQDTLVHLVAPASAGLFSSALSESGGIYGTTLSESIVAHQSVAQRLGCTNASEALSCLRAASAQALVGLESAVGPLETTGLRYVPVIDGVVIPANPLEMMRLGQQHKVPVIVGSNADETSRMVPLVSTAAEYEASVRSLFGAAAGNVLLAQYPASRFSSPRHALVALTTDAVWTCPTRRLARTLAASQSVPVYRYFFTWRAPGALGAILGASHGIDVPFVFRTFSALGFTPDAQAIALSESMQGYWARLASSGDPNGASALAWPRFPVGGDAALVFDNALSTLTDVRGADCDVMDRFSP